jgi:hypothetical protein
VWIGRRVRCTAPRWPLADSHCKGNARTAKRRVLCSPDHLTPFRRSCRNLSQIGVVCDLKIGGKERLQHKPTVKHHVHERYLLVRAAGDNAIDAVRVELGNPQANEAASRVAILDDASWFSIALLKQVDNRQEIFDLLRRVVLEGAQRMSLRARERVSLTQPVAVALAITAGEIIEIVDEHAVPVEGLAQTVRRAIRKSTQLLAKGQERTIRHLGNCYVGYASRENKRRHERNEQSPCPHRPSRGRHAVPWQNGFHRLSSFLSVRDLLFQEFALKLRRYRTQSDEPKPDFRNLQLSIVVEVRPTEVRLNEFRPAEIA